MTDHLLDLTPDQRELLELRLRRRPRQPDGTYPLSHTQEQLWFLDRLDPGDPAYNVAFGLRLTGALDVLSLRAALTSVLARHSALRTVFVVPERDGGAPRQVVRPATAVDLAVTDLRDDPAAADRVGTEHALHRFDLTAAPPVLLRLVRVADEEHLLLVAAHHIVFDASSAEVFTADLVACYDRHTVGEPVDLSPLPVGFAEHVAAHRPTDAQLAGHLAHWRERLAGAPELSTLPPDRPRPPVATHRGASVEVDLPAAGLAEFARREGVSLNAVVLAAFAAVLRRFTGQERVLLGMPVGGRAEVAQERMIGSFANMLVLDVPVGGDTVVRDLVRATHRRISDAYAHQDAPYARVVEELRPPRDPSRNPLFQAMLSLTQAGRSTRHAAGVSFTPAPVDSGRTDFDLFVTLTRDGDVLRGVVGYNTDLYLTETITTAVAAFAEALADLPGAAGRTVDEVPALARRTVSVVATFTADPVLDPARFWCDFLRLPLAVELGPYGQVVQHLLAGGTPRAQVVLLRWEDFLRHHDDGPAGPVLEAALADLTAALHAFRSRSSAPLLVAVCPPSPDHPDTALMSTMDDRLAVLCHDLGVHTVWPAAWATTYPVAERHDPHADRIAHVPYTPEYFAALGTVLARQLHRLLGGTAGRVVLDPARAPGVARLAGDRLIPVTGDLVEFLAGLPDRTGCLVLDPDEAVVAAVRARYPDTPAATTAAPGHLWPLDPPAGPAPARPVRLGAERIAVVAEQLTSAAAVAERAAPARRPSSSVDELVAPRTDLEARLARLWAGVLDVPEVGVTTDFFALGGHSLLATRLLSMVHTEFGRTVTLYTLFTHPTVESLATVLTDDADSGPPPLPRAPHDADLVPSSTQQRLWALAQLGEDAARHNTVVAAVLSGRLDRDALRGALADVMARHEVLRTTFVERAGRPVMVVAPVAGDPWLPDLDLADEPDRDRAIALRTALRRHARHPFDLATGPLLVARLVRTGEAEHHLLLGMHHIVCDNSSWGILLDELAARYAGRDLPAPAARFADYAAWQHDRLSGDELTPHVDYWRGRLVGAPPLTGPPTDHPRPATASDRAGRSRDLVPAGRVETLRELCRAEGVTPFAALLAAFGVLLSRRGGQTDLVVGVPSAGRSHPQTQTMVGCFTDLLPFRLDLSGRPSFRALARRVHRTVTEAYHHADVPFATIVEALRLPRDPASHPVFQSVFNLAELAPPAFADLDVELLDVPTSGIDFDLFLTLSWEGDGLDALLEYRADLFTPEGADGLLSDYLGVLDALLDDPDGEVGGTAGAEGARPAANTITVASTTPVDGLAATVEFWSAAAGLDAEVTLVEPGQVLRPLLDPYGPFRRGTDLAVLLVRLTDLLPGHDLTAPEALAPAVVALERWLPDLAAALRSAGRPVLLGLLPDAPAGERLAAVLTRVAERLRRFRAAGGDVELLDLTGTDPGTAIARAAARHWCPPVHTVLFGPNLTAPEGPMWTQRANGRTVAALAGAEVPDPAGCAVIDPDPAVLASAAERYPGVLTIPTADVDALWLLDGPPPAGPRLLARPDGELLARIAAGLVGQETVRGGEPRTDRERALATVFAELLKVDRVGVDDNFFELGGDSMSAIRAVSAAAAAGITITPRQLVATPTVAQLCAATGEQLVAEQGAVTGGMPLTSAQAWFFDALAPTMTNPSHFNHPYYLELRRPVPVEHLRAAVTELATHHDALRLRFPRAGWQEHAPADGAVRFDSHDLTDVPAADREAVMTDLASAAQSGLDLVAGPILRAVHFGLSGTAPDRLLVIVHHLVVDGVSRNLLLTDLAALCRAPAAGRRTALPAKTTAYRDWADRLHEYARSDTLRAELPFWVEQTAGPRADLPVDDPGARTTFGTLESVDTTLTPAETTALHEACRRLRVGVGDALTWAAVQLAVNWTGCPEWTVGTTGHGREALFDDVDTARTIGWFQVLYPIRLRPPQESAGAGVTAVAATLRTVPHNGIGYGLLRYSCPDQDVRARLATPMPQLVVNYMGAFGFADVGPGADLFDVCDRPFGLPQDAGGEWHSRLDVVGALVGDELRVELNYGTEVHREETVRARLAELRTLLTDLARQT